MQPDTDGADQWRRLTILPVKRECYASDQYFREAIRDAEDILGEKFIEFTQKITLMLVHPETLAGRRVDSLVDHLLRNRFTPICVLPFTNTRHIGREIWRYQWNAATIEKLALADRRNCALPTAIVILRDDGQPQALPAAVRLKTLKGSAVPEERDPECIRAILCSPNRMITFVHTSDEPADVVRELGICFDRAARRRILSDLVANPLLDVTDECLRLLKRLEAEAPRVDFDPHKAWARILGQAMTEDVRDELVAQSNLFSVRGTIEWQKLVGLCSQIRVDEWDLLTIWTAAVEHQDDGLQPLIKLDGEAIEAWRKQYVT